jgi:mono/diheme cytochrome c family protein
MRRVRRWRIPALFGVSVIAVTLVGCGPGGAPGSALSLTATATTADPLPTLDPGEVTLGRQVYLQNCASCHGANAQGAPNWTEPDARGNLPPPPHDDSGHTWRHGDAELAGIIRNGMRDVFNKTPELTMPPFKDRLSDEEIAAVIAYFKSLWSAEHRRFQEEQGARPAMPMATPAAD